MLNPLYTAVSWVLLRWHAFFDLLGMNPDSGLTWTLSIVFLVVTARVLLFRFFIKQVHSQRRMQEMQPQIKKLQEKHKGDKATLQREMMALQQAEGFNPISGCLPIFLQLPIFISLFHVLKHLSAAVNPAYPVARLSLYGFTTQQTLSAAHAKLFGQAPLAASLRESSVKIAELGGQASTSRIVTLVLVLISAAATFITQRAVISNATTPAVGQAATIQRLMLVGIPLSVIGSGLFFPLGVLLYWFTSNLWTMGQQFYIFRFHPHKPMVKTAALDEAGPKVTAPRPGQKPTAKGGRLVTPGAVAGSAETPPPKVDGDQANGGQVNGGQVNGGRVNGGQANGNRAKGNRANGKSGATAVPLATDDSAAKGGRSGGGPSGESAKPPSPRPRSTRAPAKKRR